MTRKTQNGLQMCLSFGLIVLLFGCALEGKQTEEVGKEHKKPSTTGELEPYECGNVTRLHTINNVFLGSQPSESDLDQAKKGGIRTVISLRHPSETPQMNEEKVVTEKGMKFYNLAFNGPKEFTDEIIDKTRRLLNEVERPVFLHCSSANRVGAVWIPYRVLDTGATLEKALEEAETIGLRSPDYRKKAIEYVKKHQD